MHTQLIKDAPLCQSGMMRRATPSKMHQLIPELMMAHLKRCAAAQSRWHDAYA